MSRTETGDLAQVDRPTQPMIHPGARPGDEWRRLAAVVGTGLVVLGAAWWGERLLAAGEPIHLGAPPVYGVWREGAGWENLWTPPLLVALGTALVVPAWWVRAVAHLRWAWVLVGSWAWALVWSVALAATNGAARLSAPLLDPRYEYLPWARQIESPGRFVSGFVEQVSSLPTHVRGHPPGAVLAFWGLDRVFTTDRSLTAALLVLAATAAPASLIALRSVADESTARRAAPFVGLAPAAVWVATSPDALFAAVVAWAVMLGALAWADSGRRAVALAALSGIAAGGAVCLSYGAAVMLAPLGAIGVLLATRRRVAEVAAVALGSAVLPLGLVVMGFDWFDGLAAVREEYLAGVGSERPYWFFLLAGPAALAVAVGPAAIAGLATLRDRRVWWLVGGALVGVLLADLSGMSKGEAERIWLPAVPWLVIATSSLPSSRSRSLWAAASMAVALVVQWRLLGPW